MQYPTIEELLAAGVHFGHLSSRWNPKMKPFIFGTRSRIHIIDLDKTLEQLGTALEFVKGVAQTGGVILFVGTKRQAKEEVRKAALAAGMPYVTIRWLGGTFTNFKTIQKSIKKLEKLKQQRAAEDFGVKYTKKERLLIEREIEKLEKLFEGIMSLKKLPEAVFVVDVNHDKIAVKEARRTGVKVVGLTDTNTDLSMVDYPIAANDDAISAIALMTNLVAEAAQEGKSLAPAPAAIGPAEVKEQTTHGKKDNHSGD